MFIYAVLQSKGKTNNRLALQYRLLGEGLDSFYLLLPDDQVYMEKEVDRKEYVLADHGYLWYGNIRKQSAMPWVFGQVINQEFLRKDLGL